MMFTREVGGEWKRCWCPSCQGCCCLLQLQRDCESSVEEVCAKRLVVVCFFCCRLDGEEKARGGAGVRVIRHLRSVARDGGAPVTELTWQVTHFASHRHYTQVMHLAAITRVILIWCGWQGKGGRLLPFVTCKSRLRGREITWVAYPPRFCCGGSSCGLEDLDGQTRPEDAITLTYMCSCCEKGYRTHHPPELDFAKDMFSIFQIDSCLFLWMDGRPRLFLMF